MDFMGLAQLLERRSVQLEHNVLQLKKKVTREMISHLANSTPVDTGRAISNWKVDFYDTVQISMLPHVPGQKGSTRSGNISATITLSENQISKIKLGQLVYVRNTVDYIVDLNDGSSKQSPGGFVEASFLIAQQTINNYKLIVS